MKFYKVIGVTTALLLVVVTVSAQNFQRTANYDESLVPAYTLPDPLVCLDGIRVTTPEQWRQKRRGEILDLFETQVYGRTPATKLNTTFTTLNVVPDALDGKATIKQVRATFTGNGKSLDMNILIFLPNGRQRPAPLFLGLNYFGNHTINADPSILITTYVSRRNSTPEEMRGIRVNRWPVEHILERGYGVATIYYEDIDPDNDDGFQNGIQPLFYKAGQTTPAPDEWGSIGAWAWGLSRAMDYIETDSDIDHDRVAVLGHSRQGKASLWAGAQDTRFAIVISNDSGCGGAALSRRHFGETLLAINTTFPHWFCDNFLAYDEKEDTLPVDQHELIALMAPRPVYIASAEGDNWADQRGEYLAGYYATPVYHLFGLQGIESDTMPGLLSPVMTSIGYHIRPGGHDLTSQDWEYFMDFADMQFNNR